MVALINSKWSARYTDRSSFVFKLVLSVLWHVNLISNLSLFSTATCAPAVVTGQMVKVSPPHWDTHVQILCIKSKPHRAVSSSLCAHRNQWPIFFFYNIFKVSLRIQNSNYIYFSSSGLCPVCEKLKKKKIGRPWKDRCLWLHFSCFTFTCLT